MSYNFIYISIFPDYFHNYFKFSIPGRNLNKGIFSYETYNLRNFSIKGKVDDYPYGGGTGMLLKIEPLVKAMNKVKKKYENAYFILLSAQGKIFSQNDVNRFLEKKNIVFICGRYEGFDCRIEEYVDEIVSLGKFVSSGGEIPSLLITDCLVRAIPNSIKLESYKLESYHDENSFLFDFDSYTRPSEFENLKVPEILLSGNHKKILD